MTNNQRFFYIINITNNKFNKDGEMKIYVVGSSKNKFLPLDDIREKFLIDEKHEGDNIDFLNPWYCELTGLYYLWKHVDDDIVGLEHYRRYFSRNGRNILNKKEISDLLTKYDIITIRAGYSKANPCKTWLIRNGKWFETQKFLLFLKHYVGEDYYKHCCKFLNGDYHCLGNMFIGKKEVINEYCSFIFDVLENYLLAEEQFGRKLPKRIIGYFTEFLFGAWITWNHKKLCFSGLKFIRR